MIKEDYVSFEIAKLLKEKGFDEPTLYHYCQNNNFPTHTIDFEYLKNLEDAQFCSAPTIQMAMKWLREVHNIFISIDIYSKDLEGNIRYCVNIYKYGSRMILDTPIICNTYEESGDIATQLFLANFKKSMEE